MKILALIMLLVILPISTASTYTLGSHQVSFNVSEPYNSAAKLDPPMYMPDFDEWAYDLNMTNPNTTAIMPQSIHIKVYELSLVDFGHKLTRAWAEVSMQSIKDNGIGGYKSSTMDFKGYPAYQGSYPTQTVMKDELTRWPECHELYYEIDERTTVHVLAIGDNVPYQEILDSIEVTDAPKKPTKYAPYIISNKAGNGSKA